VSDILSYFIFDRPSPFSSELNPVYKCRAKVVQPETGKHEACRFVFSPGLTDEEMLVHVL